MAPPFALTPFTVSNSRAVSTSHRIAPSFVEYARSRPPRSPENTTPGISVTAADCAGLHPRAVTAGRRWSVPGLFAGREVQREQAPSHGWIVFSVASENGLIAQTRVRAAVSDIRQSHVDIAVIGCRSPLNASRHTALADALLPENFTLLVGVDCVHDSRFLSGDQRAPSVGQVYQNRRRTEIHVRPLGLRAVGVIRFAARPIERVTFRHLPRPEEAAGFQIKGDECVAGSAPRDRSRNHRW